jgi:hypothetical protein
MKPEQRATIERMLEQTLDRVAKQAQQNAKK